MKLFLKSFLTVTVIMEGRKDKIIAFRQKMIYATSYHDWGMHEAESRGMVSVVSPSNSVWMYRIIFHHSSLRVQRNYIFYPFYSLRTLGPMTPRLLCHIKRRI